MNDKSICQTCGITEDNGVLYNKQDYQQLNNLPNDYYVSHGQCDNKVCRLEADLYICDDDEDFFNTLSKIYLNSLEK